MSKYNKHEMSLASLTRKEGETDEELLNRITGREKNKINIADIDYMELSEEQLTDVIEQAIKAINLKKSIYSECPYCLNNKEYGCAREPIRDIDDTILGYLPCAVIEKCDMKKLRRRDM